MIDIRTYSMYEPLVIAALHLPPFPASGHPEARSVAEIIEFALRNTSYAVQAGVPALYLQDLGDHPWGKQIQPHTLASMSVVGAEIRREHPELMLGVCLMGHGSREPIAIAQALNAQFVRLKVYVGAMVKAEGILEGCAHEAITYRSACRADGIAIFADIYDRTGIPLAGSSLVETARMAVTFGRADGLILTGGSFTESLSMLENIREANFGVPLLLGGGANQLNIKQALEFADGVIVSSSFKHQSGWTRESLFSDWDPVKISRFMEAVDQVNR